MGFNGKQIVHDYCIIAATAVYMHEYNLFNWQLLHANTTCLNQEIKQLSFTVKPVLTEHF
jgi:hypothetical protein